MSIPATTQCDLYLRLSDFRDDSDGFGGREKRLRAEARRLGWKVHRVVVENDLIGNGDGNGRSRPASAFKRRKITTPSGEVKYRVIRPGFRSILDDLTGRRAQAMLAEDLDRAMRDPRDLEDLIDAAEATGASARSLSGSLILTDGGTDSEITMARVMVAMGNKSSRDTARRVSAKRGDLAAAGWYGGGPRPFGFTPDPDAPRYRKTLVQVPGEAAELRQAAGAVMAGTTLKAVARDLRDRGVPTASGVAWSAQLVRDVLLKPAIAGLAVTRTGLVPAHWPAILEREEWEAVTARLTDPSRTTTTGNEPRHLLSGIATCHCGGPVKATGSRRGDRQAAGYVCVDGYHVRRKAAGVDRLAAAAVVMRMSQHDAQGLLRPPAAPGIDAPALRAEAARLTAIGERQSAMHALGEISDAEMRAGSAARKARLGKISAALAATTAADPLEEFRGQPDPAAVWARLPLPRQRAVARLLVAVTLLPSARRGPRFDDDSVRVEYRH